MEARQEKINEALQVIRQELEEDNKAEKEKSVIAKLWTNDTSLTKSLRQFDSKVHESPWPYIAGAAGLGALFAAFLVRRPRGH